MKEDVFHLGVKALIRNNNGKILLLENNPKIASSTSPKHWDLPGGRLQKGNSVESALRREIKEEIGISDIKIGRLFDASISRIRIISRKKDIGLILFTYLCSMEDVKKVRLTDDEHISFNWFTPKEASRLLAVKFSESLIDKVAKLE